MPEVAQGRSYHERRREACASHAACDDAGCAAGADGHGSWRAVRSGAAARRREGVDGLFHALRQHQVIAGTIQRALSTDLFEIRPAQPYPEDYEAIVEQAKQERDRGIEPALAERIPNLAGYDTIFLGFPIWGETAPPIIRSFLRAHDFRGKTMRPFITHGGYGPGNSRPELAIHAPGARIEPPFVMEADQERRTLDQVNRWLGVRRSSGTK